MSSLWIFGLKVRVQAPVTDPQKPSSAFALLSWSYNPASGTMLQTMTEIQKPNEAYAFVSFSHAQTVNPQTLSEPQKPVADPYAFVSFSYAQTANPQSITEPQKPSGAYAFVSFSYA